MAKQELSLKQQYQRLTQAKAQATRNGQPTPKLDKKIEKMKAMMGSTVQKVPAAKPCQQVRGLQGCQQAAHAGWCLHSEIRFALNCSSHGKNRIIESTMFSDGQIHIAKWVRNALDLNDGDELLFEVVDNKIIFTKAGASGKLLVAPLTQNV